MYEKLEYFTNDRFKVLKYLYDIKNLGTAGAVSMETIGYQEPVIIFPVGVAVILGINLYRKKRRQDGNQNRSEK